MMMRSLKLTTMLLLSLGFSSGFVAVNQVRTAPHSTVLLSSEASGSGDDEAARLREQAKKLREQIREMEENLGDDRKRNYDIPAPAVVEETIDGMSLKNKRVLVVGANGRLGSMVCRYLLRNNPQTEVVAAVHYVGENSFTARGYGRLSYEVGAEDGVGSIGAAWSGEDRVATFEYNDEVMKDYNLQNLRLVEVELLDPVQCESIMEGVDSVIWCASDFNGNAPRAVSGLNVAFLFRAAASPTKGRVEIEGLQNLLGAMKRELTDRQRRGGASMSKSAKNSPNNFVLVSTAPQAFGNFETPFGEFNAIKRQGERMLVEDFPSITHTILQMSLYEDNFVEEGLDIEQEQAKGEGEAQQDIVRRRINRRDAARAAVNALTDEDLSGKTVQVWTALRG